MLPAWFDENRRIQALRFDRPFAGRIDGYAIGDEQTHIVEARGEPMKKIQGLPDTEVLESRARRKQEIVDRLPNPVPKDQVLQAFASIESVNAEPVTYTTGLMYKVRDGAGSVRYDVGAATNRIQTIFSEKGTEPVTPKIGALTQQALREFFSHADQMYNDTRMDEYLAQYADSYSIKYEGKLIGQGKRARQMEVADVFIQNYPHLAETVIHSATIADDGQSAVVKLTGTDRYRKQVGSIGTVAQANRPMFHNFAIVDDETVQLALVGGVIKIVHADIDKRERTENGGK